MNRRISKVGFATLRLFHKKDRIPSFDIRYSIFIIRYSLFKVAFIDQTGRFSGRRSAGGTPESFLAA